MVAAILAILVVLQGAVRSHVKSHVLHVLSHAALSHAALSHASLSAAQDLAAKLIKVNGVII